MWEGEFEPVSDSSRFQGAYAEGYCGVSRSVEENQGQPIR